MLAEEFDAQAISEILIPKGSLAIVGREDSTVGDGNTVNVPAEVIEDCPEWRSVKDSSIAAMPISGSETRIDSP